MINLILVVENTIFYKNNIVTRPWKFDIREDFNFSRKISYNQQPLIEWS